MESGARFCFAFRKFCPAKRCSGRSGRTNAIDRNAYGLENRTWNRRASSASTDTNSSNTGLNTLAGTFGSTIFRIVKTASADVTGFPSSQTASARSVIVYASPSDETSIPSRQAGHERELRVEVEQIALDVLEHLRLGGAGLQHRIERGGLAEEPAMQHAAVDGRPLPAIRR